MTGTKNIEVWLARVPPDTRRIAAHEWLQLLDRGERERMSRLQSADARLRYVLGHGLVRCALSTFEPAVAPEEWRFGRTAKGRPEVCAPHTGARPAFSVSYTQGLVACAVTANGCLGIDVEYVSESFAYTEVIARALSPAESAELSSLADVVARRQRFFEIWTLKEAYLKGMGVGLEPELTSLEFSIGENGRLTSSLQDAAAWQFWLYAPIEGFRLALACSHRSPTRVTFRMARSIVDLGEPFVRAPIAHSVAGDRS